MKKLLPILFFVLLAILAIFIKRYNSSETPLPGSNASRNSEQKNNPPRETTTSSTANFNRNQELFFTKHARCRMACRKITQKEVREILAEGKINYSKSDLQNSKGATYAVEGLTSDRQRVRIIFAPKQKHMSVVTVIDLENESACPSC